jgi:hypothetical protein
MWAWVMRRPKLYEFAGLFAAALSPDSNSHRWVRSVTGLMNVGPIQAWLSERDLPAAPARTFRQMWRARSGKS